MSKQTRELIEAFAHSHDPEYFANDAVYTQMPVTQSFNGRNAIEGMLRLFYKDAFSDAHGELRNVAADSEKGLGFIEFTFRGRHTGALMGIPATGRNVEVACWVFTRSAKARYNRPASTTTCRRSCANWGKCRSVIDREARCSAT